MQIFKYKIPFEESNTVIKFPKKEFLISMKTFQHPLSVAVQDSEIVMWAYAEDDYPPITRKFKAVGTGEHFNLNFDNMNLLYIGTVQLDGFVWHIFEDQEKIKE
jgi:hypothetical protein